MNLTAEQARRAVLTMTRKQQNRFWSKVEKRGPDECWPWTASRNRQGYGHSRPVGYRGSMLSAHVVAWILTNGPLPADKPWGLHRCDNPPCCNPGHVFPGTNAENVTDMVAKGRHRHGESDQRGEKNNSAKLTAAIVAEVRRRLSYGERGARIAASLGVSNQTIYGIKSGKYWQSVP